VRRVRSKHLAEVPLPEDQYPVGDLGADGHRKRSAEQFAFGYCGGILTTSIPASAHRASREAENCPGPIANKDPESGNMLAELHA
jgi:hypothetical protein